MSQHEGELVDNANGLGGGAISSVAYGRIQYGASRPAQFHFDNQDLLLRQEMKDATIMRVDWPMAVLGIVVSISVSLALSYFVSPIAALIEAIPGGLLIGMASQYRMFLKARRDNL